MTTTTPYEASASQDAANVAWREQHGASGDPFGLLPPLLELLGDIPAAGSWTPGAVKATSPGCWQPAERTSPASTCHRA